MPAGPLSLSTATPSLLEVADLTLGFRDLAGKTTIAVDHVSFSLARGEGLAIVGESGSGKSVTALSLARLLPMPPAVHLGGTIRIDGREIFSLTEQELRAVRGKKIAYIFQEPAAALNPVFSIRSQIAEVLTTHRPEITRIDEEIVSLLDQVGITDPAQRLGAFPHQLSGGMQQRVMIAMALAARPEILVADEPTTALDVTIQAQIMALLAELKNKLGMAVLLITHNFGIIRAIADRVAVMFRGQMVEQGPVEQLLRQPQHPYTRALIDCVPRLGEKRRRLATIGDSLG